jgi:hypothetical protein
MYRNGREVWAGLLKNATEGLASPALIVPASIVLVFGQIAPWFLLAATNGIARSVAAAAIFFSYLPRLLSAKRFHQPLWSALLHPAGILVLLAIQWHALFREVLGHKPRWKGRSYQRVPPVQAR